MSFFRGEEWENSACLYVEEEVILGARGFFCWEVRYIAAVFGFSCWNVPRERMGLKSDKTETGCLAGV